MNYICCKKQTRIIEKNVSKDLFDNRVGIAFLNLKLWNKTLREILIYLIIQKSKHNYALRI